MEIKFRLFLGGMFHYWGFIKVGSLKKAQAFVGLPNTNQESLTIQELEERSEQFINKQDKKGVDLYDGDIVQTFETRWNDDFNDTELVKDRIDVVGNTDPHLWLKNESFGYEREDLDEPDEVEIIGNIHENPELLNA